MGFVVMVLCYCFDGVSIECVCLLLWLLCV